MHKRDIMSRDPKLSAERFNHHATLYFISFTPMSHTQQYACLQFTREVGAVGEEHFDYIKGWLGSYNLCNQFI